jgi:hypothetical protein
MARKETTEELLRYTFSAEEKQILSDKLALACQQKYTAEEEKKSAMAGFKKRIDEEGANMAHFSRLVNNGWEMRPTECRIEYNSPVAGTKRIIRVDTGELVREVVMTGSEYQDTIQFVDPNAEAKLAERMRLERLEASVRDFFANVPAEADMSVEPIDVSEITSWRSLDFFFAAATEEDANKFASEHGFPLTESIAWTDPDATYFDGFEALYGDENRSCRAAIMKLFELGRTFPCLLAFPLTIVPKAVAEEIGEAAIGSEAADIPAVNWADNEAVVTAAYNGDLDAIAADGWGDRDWADNRANNPKVIAFEAANMPNPAAEAASVEPPAADAGAAKPRRTRDPNKPKTPPTTEGGEPVN